MTNDKLLITRQAYSVFDILGDFGGFNGSVFMILSTIFKVYSARIYRDQIAKKIPFKRKKLSPQTEQDIWRLRKNFYRVEDPPSLD